MMPSKRITYLKSYRNYREMQGENILRTQELLKQRIDELSGNKKKKSVVLQTQSKELQCVGNSTSRKKINLVSKLKAQGKELNNQIAAKKKQMQKVSNAIAAAIKSAQDEARREAMAKAKAEKARRDAEAKNNTAENKTTATTNCTAQRLIQQKRQGRRSSKCFLGK